MTGAAAEYRAERDASERAKPGWHFMPPQAEDDPPPPMDGEAYGFTSEGEVETTPSCSVSPIALTVRCAASLAGQPVPDRPWLVRDLIPDRTVTMFGGDGGVGKSLLALQLGVATASGTDWAGTMPEPGPVMYLSAEDDLDEIHRRLAGIAVGRFDLADLTDLHIVPLAGLDAVLGAPDRRGIVSPTPLWQAVVNKIGELRPRLLIVDNLADAFAGNENSRPEARQFVGMLRGVAIEHRLAVVLIAHPSLTGLSTGSGTSGSTAWSNSVRSRLYLDRATADDGSEPDKKLRILRLMKTNYAEPGLEIRLKWEAGRFRLDGLGAGGFDRMAAEQQAERLFVDLLIRLGKEGREVSHKRSATFAPVVFAKHPDGKSIGKAAFEAAMHRLFAAGAIKAEAHGPPSRLYSRIVLTATDHEDGD